MKLKILLPLILFLFIQGCGTGYDRVLFVTRSNVGVDLDTTPPTTKIDISRKEGVIAPSFEDGKTLPVEASFQSKSNGFTNFFYGTGSTFATGEAAVAMTALYDETDAIILPSNASAITNQNSKKNHIIGGRNKFIGFKEYHGLELKYRPKKKSILSKKLKEIDLLKEGVVKPVYFGTETSIGLNVKWGESPSVLPSAIKLGFNRKELAYAPISLREKGTGSSKKYWVNIPSLLATMEHDVTVKDGSSRTTKLNWVQYFATGDAATNLALRHTVRTAMLKQSNPSFSIVEEQFNSRQDRLQLKKIILANFEKKSPTDQQAIIGQVNAKGVLSNQIASADGLKFALTQLVNDAPNDSKADIDLKRAKLVVISDLI